MEVGIMKHTNKTFNEAKFYGYFGLVVVTLLIYMIFWGDL